MTYSKVSRNGQVSLVGLRKETDMTGRKFLSPPTGADTRHGNIQEDNR